MTLFLCLSFPSLVPTLSLRGGIDTTRDHDIKIDGWLISVRGFVRFAYSAGAMKERKNGGSVIESRVQERGGGATEQGRAMGKNEKERCPIDYI